MQNRQLSPTLTTILGINLVCLVAFNILRIPQLDSLHNLLALHSIGSEYFFPTQYFTYMFLHADMGHFLSNSLGILTCGTLLETFWGPKKFWTFYIVTGIGGGIVFSLVRYYEYNHLLQFIDVFLNNPTPEHFDSLCTQYYLFDNSQDLTPIIKSFYANKSQANEFIALVQSWKSHINSGVCVGASAAVFGLLFAFAYYFPNTEVSILFLPFTMPVKYFVIIYGAIELYSGVNRIPGDKIAHWGHLGGIIFAYILIMIWQKSRKSLF